MLKKKVLVHIVTNPFIVNEEWLRLKILNLIFGIKDTKEFSYHLKITYWNPYVDDIVGFIISAFTDEDFNFNYIKNNHLPMLFDIYNKNISYKTFPNFEKEFSKYFDSIKFESSTLGQGYNGGSHLLNTWNEVEKCIEKKFDYYYFESTNYFSERKNTLSELLTIHEVLTTRSILFDGVYKTPFQNHGYHVNTSNLNSFSIKIANLKNTFSIIENDNNIKINSFKNLTKQSFLKESQLKYKKYFKKTSYNNHQEVISKLNYEQWVSKKIFPLRNLEDGVAFFDFLCLYETSLNEDEFLLHYEFLFPHRRFYCMKETLLILNKVLKIYNIKQPKNSKIKYLDDDLDSILKTQQIKLNKGSYEYNEENLEFENIEIVRKKLINSFNQTFYHA